MSMPQAGFKLATAVFEWSKAMQPLWLAFYLFASFFLP